MSTSLLQQKLALEASNNPLTGWTTTEASTELLLAAIAASTLNTVLTRVTAYVANNGSDIYGRVGDIFHPYATGNKALIDLKTVKEDLGLDGAIVRLDVGTFAPIQDDSFGADTLLFDWITWQGSQVPGIATDGNSLGNGTVLQGPFTSDRPGTKFRCLGVDSGLDVITELHAGVAKDALGLCINIGQIVPEIKPPRLGLEAHDVIALCKTANSAVHAFLCENGKAVLGSNIKTSTSFHGFVVKCDNFLFTNVQADNHGGDAGILKSDPYARCRNGTISNFIASNSAGGMYFVPIHSEGMSNITVNGLVMSNCTNEIAVLGSTFLRNVTIEASSTLFQGHATPSGEPNVSLFNPQIEGVTVNGVLQAGEQEGFFSVLSTSTSGIALAATDDYLLDGDFTLVIEVARGDDNIGGPFILFAGPTGGGPALYLNARTIEFDKYGTGPIAIASAIGWTPWNHELIAITRSGNNFIIYRNEATIPNVTTSLTITSRITHIGRLNGGAGGGLDGKIYGAWIYKGRVLTKDEIGEIRKYGRTLDETDCTFRMDLSTSTGSTVKDASPATHDATLTGDALLLK